MAEPDAVQAQPEIREIATIAGGRDITRGYVDPLALLRPLDPVLLSRGGGNYTLYREVLRDDQVAAVFGQRRLAVTSREWEVRAGGEKRIDKQAAKFLEEQLERIEWDKVTEKMLYGVFYGYAVAEMLWAREGSQIVIDRIKVRDRRRFGYDGAGALRLLTGANPAPGELLPARKFWTFATGADHDDEPYGLGLAHWLYWPVWFKRNGIKFWLIFLEKFGQPTAKGTYPAGAAKEERTKLLSALAAISTDAGVIVPEGMMIELIEAARSGTADYTELYDRMNAAIAKVVLGQTLTTEAAGGQYKAEVQMDVRQDLVKADADLVCQSFNLGPARWLTEWNFPGAAFPQVWRLIEDPEDINKAAERDKTLSEIGFRPTLARVRSTYGDDYEDTRPALPSPSGAAGEGDLPAAPAPAFAEGNADPIPVTAMTARLTEEAAAAMDGLIAPVRDLVMQAQSLEELRDGLLARYAEMDVGDLAVIMQRAFTAAELAGRFEVSRTEVTSGA